MNFEKDKKTIIYENSELSRVVKFLRGEITVLRKEIDNILKSPEYLIGLKIFNNIFIKSIRKVVRKFPNISKADSEKPKKIPQDADYQISPPKILAKSGVVNCEILFIQLSNNAEIGGIYQLNSVFEEMVRRGADVKSYYINRDFSVPEIGFDQLENIEKYKFKKIVFSGLESFIFLNNSLKNRDYDLINFFQGPDYLFPGNENCYEQYVSSLKQSKAVIAQSPYLEKLATFLGSKEVRVITLGPKESIFVDELKNKEKTMLVPTRRDPDKGLRFSLPIFSALRENGWKIVGFGDLSNSELANHFDEHVGRISREELSQIYQSAAIMLDLSLYEGLGLSALEAGMCGVRPVVSKKGGIESLENFKNELIYIDDFLDLNQMKATILNSDNFSDINSRNRLREAAKLYSWESNIDYFIKAISNH